MARVRKKTADRAAAANRVRIIGGRWRGAPLEVPPIAAVRPSPDRVRETLFNWLQTQILGARCLDLFAGSGALGVEALSRGAAHVTFVDHEPRIARHLTQTLQRLGAESAATILAEDSRRFLTRPPQRYNVVFLDPPFASGLLQEICDALGQGWLEADGWIYVECPAAEALPRLPTGWTVHRTKRAGQVGYHLLHVASDR